MKRVDLFRHLEAHGCALLREGGNHTVYVNRVARKVSTVPRHRELNDELVKKICKDLEIPRPGASNYDYVVLPKPTNRHTGQNRFCDTGSAQPAAPAAAASLRPQPRGAQRAPPLGGRRQHSTRPTRPARSDLRGKSLGAVVGTPKPPAANEPGACQPPARGGVGLVPPRGGHLRMTHEPAVFVPTLASGGVYRPARGSGSGRSATT